MRLALAGNPNSGKTTLFNVLTGAHQHVGNFPGITVAGKWGTVRDRPGLEIVDLPGMYSLTSYSGEEAVAEKVLREGDIDGIIQVADVTSPQRSMYLTLQLLELGIPMVLALNMMDELTGNGGTVDPERIGQHLGIPVIPVSASQREGTDELLELTIRTVMHKRRPDKKIPAELARRAVQQEATTGMEAYACTADVRYRYIEAVCRRAIRAGQRRTEYRRSLKIDRVVTHRYLAFPIFFLIMGLMFVTTFELIGGRLSDLGIQQLGRLTLSLDQLLRSQAVNPVLHSLIVDGILTGVGSVLSFLPIILCLFFWLSLLEDSGYMARVAFIMDRPLRRLGLSGKSIVPLLIGFGCTVPAVMAARTLSGRRERMMVTMLTPFMSCSAKMPVYAVFAAAFFRENRVLIVILLYLIGIGGGILCALLLKRTGAEHDTGTFLMELPNYRIPSPRSVLMLMWEKAKDFLSRAFTVILWATMVVWFLQHFNYRLEMTEYMEESMLASLGQALLPIFEPAGITDWRMVAALLTGLTAKETVLSTLAVLAGTSAAALEVALVQMFTPLSAFCYLIFILFYTPCVAAVATVRKETGSVLATVLMVVMQCSIAWGIALIIYQAGCFLGMG